MRPTRWQLRQREGVTPAYVNGDALAGNRDLVAGDVIELIGVRLRFEVALSMQPVVSLWVFVCATVSRTCGPRIRCIATAVPGGVAGPPHEGKPPCGGV